MKIVVIGGTGLIGSKLVNKLHALGHEAISASPSSGVNTLTGEGLPEVMQGASVVVDVTNSPSWEDGAVLDFFKTSTCNLLMQEKAAGVKHHVVLSVVGTERLLESGFFRAKLAQEKLVETSSIPYSIVRATQFFEFAKNIAGFSSEGDQVRLPHVLFQPMSAEDVADAVAEVATAPPANGIVEAGGPEKFHLDEFVRRALAANNDLRAVVTDPNAHYFGIAVDERTLLPGESARLGITSFEQWLTQSTTQGVNAHRQPA